MNIQKHKGIVLVSVLILLVSMTLVAVTIANRSTMDEQIAANTRDYVNAMMVAESGLEAAFAEIENNLIDTVQSEFTESSSFLLNEANLCDLAGTGTPVTGLDGVSVSGGTYTVTVQDCNVARTQVALHSQGNYAGSQRNLETILEVSGSGPSGGSSPGTSKFSFLANDYIEIATNFFVGPLIHIHTFGKVKVSGSPYTCVSEADCGNLETAPVGYVTAYEYDPKTYEMVTKNPYPWDLNGPDYDGLGTLDDNPYDIFADYGIAYGDLDALAELAKETIPHIYPPDWYQYSTIELSADCKVYAGPANTEYTPGTLIWDEEAQGTWNQWTCGVDTAWTVKTEGVLYDAFYYVWGNVKAGGSGSKQTNGPWNATIVTTGSFEAGCCPAFGTWNQPTGHPDADNLFLLAGNDILIQSAPEQVISGIIAAHREIKLSGSQSHYRGTVIAENGLHHDYVNFPNSDMEVVDNADLGIDVQVEWNRADINVINSDTVLEGTGVGFGGSAAGEEGGGSAVTKRIAWREIIN